MVVYSHSRLSTFEKCPLKFKYKYIDKIKPEFKMSIEAHLGKSVHDTLEWIYNSIINKNQTPTVDEIINYYTNKWTENSSQEIKIVKNNLTNKDYFNKGVKFLMDYYLKHQPFKDGTLECEKRILIEINSYKLQGYIDRLVHNKETGEYEIHDYKTANFLPTQETLDQDKQLALYSIAIQELVGQDKKICLIWHYLAHNKKICSYRTSQQIEQLKKEITELIQKIESAKFFPYNQSALCNWCEYKYACPAFGNKPKELQKSLSF